MHNSEWLKLGESVQYAVDRGIGDVEAKLTICTAIAHRRVKITGLLMRPDEKPAPIYDINIPGYLEPGNFDWDNSYPIGKLWEFRDILGQRSASRQILVKLSAADVYNLFDIGKHAIRWHAPDKGGRPPGVDWGALKDALREEITIHGHPNSQNPPGWQRLKDVVDWATKKLGKSSEDVSTRTIEDNMRRLLRELNEEASVKPVSR